MTILHWFKVVKYDESCTVFLDRKILTIVTNGLVVKVCSTVKVSWVAWV